MRDGGCYARRCWRLFRWEQRSCKCCWARSERGAGRVDGWAKRWRCVCLFPEDPCYRQSQIRIPASGLQVIGKPYVHILGPTMGADPDVARRMPVPYSSSEASPNPVSLSGRTSVRKSQRCLRNVANRERIAAFRWISEKFPFIWKLVKEER